MNPFSGANEHEVAELLIAAFDLETRNTDSDVYKISEQKSAQKIADFVVQNRLHLSQVSERIDLILSEEEQKSSRGLIERIETLSRLGALKVSCQGFCDPFARIQVRGMNPVSRNRAY